MDFRLHMSTVIVRCIFLPLIVLPLIVDAYASEDKRTARIAVFDVGGKDIPFSVPRIVRHLIEIDLCRSGKFHVLEREDVDKVFIERKKISPPDPNAMVVMGKDLFADFIVVGSIEKTDDCRLNIRVVSIHSGEIVAAYSARFSDETKLEATVQRITRRLVPDLLSNIKKGVKKNRSCLYDIIVFAHFHSLFPLRDLAEIVLPGFGCSFGIMIEHAGADNVLIGFETGYQRFSGEQNASDSCTFIPFSFLAGYSFHFVREFFIAPLFSAGMNVNILKHGNGFGFSMNENSETISVNPLLRAGVLFGFVPIADMHIHVAFDYYVAFERKGILDYLAARLGLAYIF